MFIKSYSKCRDKNNVETISVNYTFTRGEVIVNKIILLLVLFGMAGVVGAVGIVPETDLITSYSSTGGTTQFKDNNEDLLYRANQGDAIIFSITSTSTSQTVNYLWRVLQGSQVIASSSQVTTCNWTVPSATSTWEIEVEATEKDGAGNTKGRESVSWSITTSDLQIVNPGGSIQTGIDSLPFEGGIVELAAGIHSTTSTIEVIGRSNITIRGAGASREDTEIRYDGYYPLFSTFHIQGSSNITIRDIYVNSTASGFISSSVGDGIVLNHTDSLRISNIRIEKLNSGISTEVGGYGYRPENERNTNVVVENSIFAHMRCGMILHAFHNSTIRNNEVFNCTAWMCIDFNTGNADDVIENNTVYGSVNSGIKLYSSNMNISVRNNNVYGNNNYGILLLQGADNITILNNTVQGNSFSGIGVTSYNTLSASINSTIRNNIIYNNGSHGIYIGIYEIGQVDFGDALDYRSYIESNTVYSNGEDGINLDYPNFTVSVKNNIITNNGRYGINRVQSVLNSSYNDVWNNSIANFNGTSPGPGDISLEPLFNDTALFDFHLRSREGRWNGAAWVSDTVSSPCIDAGDPSSDYSNEPQPNGGRINMGAYGNTDEASKSFTQGTPPPPAVRPEETNGKPYVFPVPFEFGKDSLLTFRNLEYPSLLEIYSIDGILLHEKETSGPVYSFVPDNFPSGVYAYLIKNSKGTNSGKFVIIK